LSGIINLLNPGEKKRANLRNVHVHVEVDANTHTHLCVQQAHDVYHFLQSFIIYMCVYVCVSLTSAKVHHGTLLSLHAQEKATAPF